MGDDVEVQGTGACGAEDVAFGGQADGPFHSIGEGNHIYDIESSRVWWSGCYTGNVWVKVMEKFPAG